MQSSRKLVLLFQYVGDPMENNCTWWRFGSIAEIFSAIFFANAIQQNTILTFWNQLQKFLNISFYTPLKSSCDLIHFVLSWTCLFGPLPACITLLPFSHSSFCLDPVMQANMKLCLLKKENMSLCHFQIFIKWLEFCRSLKPGMREIADYHVIKIIVKTFATSVKSPPSFVEAVWWICTHKVSHSGAWCSAFLFVLEGLPWFICSVIALLNVQFSLPAWTSQNTSCYTESCDEMPSVLKPDWSATTEIFSLCSLL